MISHHWLQVENGATPVPTPTRAPTALNFRKRSRRRSIKFTRPLRPKGGEFQPARKGAFSSGSICPTTSESAGTVSGRSEIRDTSRSLGHSGARLLQAAAIERDGCDRPSRRRTRRGGHTYRRRSARRRHAGTRRNAIAPPAAARPRLGPNLGAHPHSCFRAGTGHLLRGLSSVASQGSRIWRWCWQGAWLGRAR